MSRILAATLIVLMALVSWPARAEPQVTYGELSQQQRIAFIETLIARGDHRTAETFLSNSRFTEGDTGYRAAFAQAIVFGRTGRLAAAEALLRRILDERPAYSGVRLELARVLALRGNRQGAAHHLQLLAAAAPDQEGRERFERFIDQINPDKPFAVGGFVTIAPSTNINGGSGHDIIFVNGLPFVIDRASRAESGIGLRAGLNVALNHRLSERISLYAAGSGVVSEYSGSRFDTLTGDARLGVRYRDSRRLIAAELITDRRWINYRPFDHGTGGRVLLRQPLAPRWLFSGEAQFMRRDYDRDPQARLHTFTASAQIGYAFSAGRSVYAKAGYEREQAPFRAHNAYVGGHVEVGGYAELPFGVNGALALKVGRNQYDGPFPGQGFARRDTFFEVRASFLKRDWSYGGFTPRLSLSYYRQISNVPLYDYDKIGADISFTKDF